MTESPNEPDPTPHSTADSQRGAATTPPPRTGRSLAVAVVILALVIAAGYVGWRTWLAPEQTAGGDTPTWTPSASPTSQSTSTISSTPPASSSPASSPSATLPPGCSATTTPMDNPTTLSIEAMKVSAPMLSLGLDESGAAAAPPKNASHSVGWFNQGPKIGASKGKAVLTIHTYRNGGALGNELNDPKTGLKPGTLVRIRDTAGVTTCYTYEKALKVWVKDYDPNSKVLYDDDGAPQAVIVICWDFNRSTEAWDSRVLFYLKPLAPAAG